MRDYSLHYIATGIFDRNYSDTIKEAEALRNAADYKDMQAITKEEAKDIIDKAKGFIDIVKIHVTERCK